MSHLTVFADAGGTKTIGVAVRAVDGGTFEAHAGTCVPSKDMAGAIAEIGQLLSSLRSQADSGAATPIRLALSSAGVDDAETLSRFREGIAPLCDDLRVVGDGEAALLGCVGDADGSVISVGTGVAGFRRSQGTLRSFDGWGWPAGDRGGGAWIGLRALEAFLAANDDRRVGTDPLFEAMALIIGRDRDRIFSWLNLSDRRRIAELAVTVAEQLSTSPTARALIESAAGQIVALAKAMEVGSGELLHLTGGVSKLLLPFLPTDVVHVEHACLLGARHLALDWIVAPQFKD